MPVRKLKEFLDKNDVKYVTMNHSPAYTAQEVAARAHVPGKELAKTVMVNMDGKMAMAVLPASYQVDFHLLKEALGAKEIDLASEGEFGEMFPECELGAMPPFGNLYGMDVYVAESLTEDEEIVFNAGSHTELIKMAYGDFERLATPKILRFSSKYTPEIAGEEGSAMKIYDPKKILVPVDFSEMSPAVIQAAVEIGEIRNAEVDVLHVAEEPKIPSYHEDGYTPFGESYAPSTSFPNKLWEDTRARLERQLEGIVRKVPTRAKVKTTLLWGNPVKEIVREAESGNFDLIVMATHGREGMSRLFIGSVTEEVIRRASCPVFVIRAKVAEEHAGVSTIEEAEVS